MNQTPDPPKPKKAVKATPSGGLGELLRTWGPAILVVIFIRSVIASPFRIPSGSMVPTLEIGDHILVSKLSYGLHVPWIDLENGPGFLGLPFTTIEIFGWDEPARGDIVVFKYPPAPATDYIKRIVGLPGDVIEVRDNTILINGVESEKTYGDKYDFVDDDCVGHDTQRYTEDLEGIVHDVLTGKGNTPLSNYGPYTVPAGNYFAMGDNRDNSSDSRVWGPVPRDHIRGRALFTWLSLDACEEGIPMFGKPRAERIGHALK